MILKALVEFDSVHGEALPTGYRRLDVHWLLRLGGSGFEVVSQIEREGKKERGRQYAVPDLKRSGTTPGAALFCDLASYVLARAERDSKKDTGAYRKRYLALARECVASSSDERIKRVFEFMQALDIADPALSDIQANHRVNLEVDGVLVTDIDDVQKFWATHVRKKTAAKAGGLTQMQCLVTGQICEPVRIFPQKIVGVPNTNQGQADLVSFNEEAFRSYGLEQTLNAPISPEAAQSITRALNRLLTTDRHHLRLGPVVFVAWSHKNDEENFMRMLDEPQPEVVKNLLNQVKRGGASAEPEPIDYFVLSMTGAKSRIIVRDYHETTLANVKRNIAKWFKRLELAGADGEPLKPIGLYRLAASLYRDANKEMPAHVPTDLMSAALHGRPLPDYLLGLAVKRNLAMQGPFALTKAKTKTLSTGRLAMIKAALTPDPEDTSLNELNLNQSNPAYHCGRMLAVLESIQRLAIPGLNATLVDRNYGAACASPASIFGNLLKDATSAHLPKLRKNRPGAYVALDKRLQEVAVAIGPAFPRTLTLKDQGLFSLGYYHQRAWDMAEAKKNKELKELAELDSAQEEDTTE